jgi:hypothetical protein
MVMYGTVLSVVIVAGCVPGMSSYLDLPSTASTEELQAAWDARLPPGTTRAHLLAQLPPFTMDPGFGWPGLGGWGVYEDEPGTLIVDSEANQFNRNAQVFVEITFDSQDRIAKSVVHKGAVCL